MPKNRRREARGSWIWRGAAGTVAGLLLMMGLTAELMRAGVVKIDRLEVMLTVSCLLSGWIGTVFAAAGERRRVSKLLAGGIPALLLLTLSLLRPEGEWGRALLRTALLLLPGLLGFLTGGRKRGRGRTSGRRTGRK